MKRAKRSPLEHVKHLIQKLSAEERQQIVPFLAEFSDSGVQSYDLTEEIEALEKHGTRLPPEGSHDNISLVFIRDLVEIFLANRKIAHARFFAEEFIAAFPAFRDQVALISEAFQKIEESKALRRANLKAQGVVQTDAEFEIGFKQECDKQAEVWITEKSKRVAERISRHFPGIIGDAMIAAIKGETFYDLAEVAKAFGKNAPSSAPIKKAVQDLAWRDLKPYLPSTRHIRTHPDWQGDENKKLFARKVNERKALASAIKDKYEECDFEAGWTEDLKQDSTYQLLSTNVPQTVIDHGVRRVASELSERELQPLSIALEMARFELDLKEQDIETLHKYYAEGVKLLKAERNRPTSSI